MAKSLGIYLRNGAVQAAVVTGTSKKPKLKKLVEIKSSAKAEDGIAKAFKENGISAKVADVAIPSRFVTVRKTSLPLKSVQQIEKTIKFQVEKFMPGVSPDEVVVDFFITGKKADHTELILLIVNKKDLARELEILKSSGIEPESISVDFIAMFNMISMSGIMEGSGNCMLVDFSGQDLSILIVKGCNLVDIRKLPPIAGGDSYTLAGKLSRELEYSWKAAAMDGKPDAVVISGNVPVDLSIDTLEKEIGTEVKVFNPASIVGSVTEKETEILLRKCPVAAAAAMGGLGRVPVNVNFLKEEYVYRSPYEILRKPIMIAAVMIIMFITIELFITMEKTTSATVYYEALKKEAKKRFSEVVKGKSPKFTSTFDKTLENYAASGKAGLAATEGWPSFLDFLKLLSEKLPSNDERTIIHSISFKGTRATIRGDADDMDSFEDLSNALEKSGDFEVRAPFRMKGKSKGPKKQLAFTIELSPGKK